MAKVVPLFSKGRVDAAGRVLTKRVQTEQEMDEALDVLNNWRSSHSHPLNTFQWWLRRHAPQIYDGALVAQRLKRVPSIVQKLERYPSMNLSRMQDIGGCRAVMRTVAQVRALRGAYAKSDAKHVLVNEKDYIEQPKASGYRGIHLVYRYHSDKQTTYNGLMVEVQLRSQIQHAWATAVEIVGTFLQQALKSSEGPEQWLEFFALTGSAFASLEKTPLVPGAPPSDEVRRTVAQMASELEVSAKLSAYGHALQVASDLEQDARYYLLALEPDAARLTIHSYQVNELPRATAEYLETEKRLAQRPGAQVVLVAAESFEALRRAYPNYFLDTQVFLRELARVIAA